VTHPIHIVGAGLAGSECAFQLASRGVPVVLHEMRPQRRTEAHQTDRCAELVCSNSFRSDDPLHAAGLLKREMEAFNSLIIAAARAAAVPAGSALAVDRQRYAAQVTATLEQLPGVQIRRHEVRTIPTEEVILATGPLTSAHLAAEIRSLLGSDYLYFYDSIAPVVESDSLDHERLFWASRYGKGGGADYLNAALDHDQYLAFHAAVCAAEVVPLHDFEERLFFEGCLPVEEIARRGVNTLRFGPMKPVGLTAPDGSRPYAVVQLRQENLSHSHFNLVGFQSRMTWPDQRRVFRTIPGLERAEFVRLGQVHRNTFVNAPVHLDPFYRLKSTPHVRLAGQITGVEGYLESAATGLAAALYIVVQRRGQVPEPLPATTALGALARHLTRSDPRTFQPANINYGLFTSLERRVPKAKRREAFAERGRQELDDWRRRHDLVEPVATSIPTG
jgi:methylenetetrahydrofolate--tRNA-(uracil-5-)-methyltransferase